MKLLDFNRNPTDRQLFQFGLITVVAFPAIGWVWGFGLDVIVYCMSVGIFLAAIGFIYPQALKPVFITLTFIAMPIGWVVGELSMLAIYLLIFLPIGLLFSIRRRDPLQLQIRRANTTYWQPKKQPDGPERYFHQF